LTLEKIRKGPIMGRLRNPHPDEILKEEFLKEIGVSENQLAQRLARRAIAFTPLSMGRAILRSSD
jgi:plasmid maintenance system antidote protein VapI